MCNFMSPIKVINGAHNMIKPKLLKNDLSLSQILSAIRIYNVATKFMEAGSDATGDTSFFDVVTGSVSSSTSVVHTGNRSLKFDSGSSAQTLVRKNYIANFDTRISFYFYFEALPAADTGICDCTDFNNSSITWRVKLKTTGVLALADNNDTIQVTGTTTLSINTWYRICIATTGTSVSSNTIKVYIDSVLDITGTNIALFGEPRRARWGWTQTGAGTNKICYFSDIYVDNDNSTNDIGDIRIVAKTPVSNNTNNFDTAIGNSPSNRWENVNEVPRSDSNGWKHAETSAVQENYGLAADTEAGKVIDGPMLAKLAWFRGKRDTNDGAFVRKLGTNTNKTAGTTLVITNGATASVAGNTIILAFSMDNDTNSHPGGTISATDSAGNTYEVAVVRSSTLAAGAGAKTAILFCQNAASIAATTGTITITHPSVTARAGIAMEFFGIAPSPLQSVASTTGTLGATTPLNTLTIPAREHAEIIVAALGWEGPASDWSAVGTGMTPDQTHVDAVGTSGGGAASNMSVEAQYTIQDTATNQNGDGTLANDRDNACCVASFKCDGGGNTKIMDDGTESNLALTIASQLNYIITDTTTYPVNAAGIGMKTAAIAGDCYLYECGTLIAFIPNFAATGASMTELGTKRGSRQAHYSSI